MFAITLGTPEEHVPSKYKPYTETEEAPLSKFPADRIAFRRTKRGAVIEYPLDASEELFGFGLQMKGFACRGTKKVLRPNADPVANTGDSHAPVPFYVSTKGYGVCVDTLRNAEFYCGYHSPGKKRIHEGESSRPKDNPGELYGLQDAGENDSMLINIPFAEGVTLYIFEGKNITDVVSQYNMFSGGGCLPPLWGLGNIYRCYTGYNSDQVIETAEYFRNNKLPLSCIGLEPGWQTHAYSCTYEVNKNLYPDFGGMAQKLKEKHIELNLWEHAFVHPSSPIYDELAETSGDLSVWDGLVPDFADEKAREIFAEYHRKHLVELGVTGFKLDECDGSDYTGSWSYPNCTMFPSGLDGEQMHHIYGVLYQQAMLKALGQNKTYGQVRNSGAFAASYPFALYSDLYDHRDFIRAMCTSGLSGLLWAPELREGNNREDLIRRLQTVVFSAQSLINGWYINGIPWEKLGCADEAEKLLNMRMQLIPYLLAAFFNYKTTGKPPVRPLAADYTNDPATYSCDNEYMLGDIMLVAPMVEGEAERAVYLPGGAWYDLWRGKRYDAGTHTVKTADIPVFIQADSVLPLAEPLQYADETSVFGLELVKYGEGGTAALVEPGEDKVIVLDGSTMESGSSRYVIRKITEIK